MHTCKCAALRVQLYKRRLHAQRVPMALARSAKDADANIVYVAYDLEATGLDTNTDSIVEFSASVLIPPGEHSAALIKSTEFLPYMYRV